MLVDSAPYTLNPGYAAHGRSHQILLPVVPGPGLSSSSQLLNITWKLVEKTACATVYGSFDPEYQLPAATDGALPSAADGTICNSTTYNFVPSFGKFTSSSCGDKLVGGVGQIVNTSGTAA